LLLLYAAATIFMPILAADLMPLRAFFTLFFTLLMPLRYAYAAFVCCRDATRYAPDATLLAIYADLRCFFATLLMPSPAPLSL